MLLELDSVSKHYHLGGQVIRALDKVTVGIREGEFVAVKRIAG